MTPTTDHPSLRIFAPTSTVGLEGQKASVPSRVEGAQNAFAGLIAEFSKEHGAANKKIDASGIAGMVMPDLADHDEPEMNFPSTLDQLRLGTDAATPLAPRTASPEMVGKSASSDSLPEEHIAINEQRLAQDTATPLAPRTTSQEMVGQTTLPDLLPDEQITVDEQRLGQNTAKPLAPHITSQSVTGQPAPPDPLPDEYIAPDQGETGTETQNPAISNLITPLQTAFSGASIQNASQGAGTVANAEAAPAARVSTDAQPNQQAAPAKMDIGVAGAVAARAPVASTPALPNASERRPTAQRDVAEQKSAAESNITPSVKAPATMPFQMSSVADSRTAPVINRATPNIEITVQSIGQSPTVADAVVGPQPLVDSPIQSNLGQGFDALIQNASNQAANALPTTVDAPQQISEPVVISTTNPNWEVEFVDSIVAQVSGADAVIEIALSPENLGQIDIKVEMREGRADVTFVTETRDAARLFAQAEGRLSDLMQRHGLNLGGQDTSQRQGDQRPFATGRANAPKDNEATINAKAVLEGRVNLVA